MYHQRQPRAHGDSALIWGCSNHVGMYTRQQCAHARDAATLGPSQQCAHPHAGATYMHLMWKHADFATTCTCHVAATAAHNGGPIRIEGLPEKTLERPFACDDREGIGLSEGFSLVIVWCPTTTCVHKERGSSDLVGACALKYKDGQIIAVNAHYLLPIPVTVN
jgi:hypothetical protein